MENKQFISLFQKKNKKIKLKLYINNFCLIDWLIYLFIYNLIRSYSCGCRCLTWLWWWGESLIRIDYIINYYWLLAGLAYLLLLLLLLLGSLLTSRLLRLLLGGRRRSGSGCIEQLGGRISLLNYWEIIELT